MQHVLLTEEPVRVVSTLARAWRILIRSPSGMALWSSGVSVPNWSTA
jgi:hypothetical protein